MATARSTRRIRFPPASITPASARSTPGSTTSSGWSISRRPTMRRWRRFRSGQINEAHSISAGLDYPGIGPEHAWLNDIKRVEYLSATDDEALAAFQLCSRLEGIIPALEPAHALARVIDLAPEKPRDHLMVVNLSGRGDKDLASVADYLDRRGGGRA